MLFYDLGRADPIRSDTAGATLGQRHVEPLLSSIKQNPQADGLIVLLNFDGIKTTTASYVKATVLWMLRCGQASTGSLILGAPQEASTPIAIDIYPAVTGLNEETREEIDEVFTARSLPYIEANTWDDNGIVDAFIRGAPDTIVRRTFELLVKHGEGTATGLYEQYPQEKISVTGWNNRLADLHSLRLAKREKQGRAWIYRPIVRVLL